MDVHWDLALEVLFIAGSVASYYSGVVLSRVSAIPVLAGTLYFSVIGVTRGHLFDFRDNSFAAGTLPPGFRTGVTREDSATRCPSGEDLAGFQWEGDLAGEELGEDPGRGGESAPFQRARYLLCVRLFL